jgi:hypothetical protein
MLADATASALLALWALPSMFTDATASALLALGAFSSMFTDATASALLAPGAPSSMFTDATASALLALWASSSMFTATARHLLAKALEPLAVRARHGVGGGVGALKLVGFGHCSHDVLVRVGLLLTF